jgi:hypothetical protein
MALAGRSTTNTLKVIVGGLGNEDHGTSSAEPSHDQPLKKKAYWRRVAAHRLIATNCPHHEEIVAGNNAFLMVTKEAVISISVIGNMDQINIFGAKSQPDGKE